MAGDGGGHRRTQEVRGSGARHRDDGGGGGNIRQPDGVRKEEKRPDLAKFWPPSAPYIYTGDYLLGRLTHQPPLQIFFNLFLLLVLYIHFSLYITVYICFLIILYI